MGPIEHHPASLSPELRARAEAAGLEWDPHGWSRAQAVRPGGTERLVGRDDAGLWWWAPESEPWSAVVRAPRFATQAEALTYALDWVDAGEPARCGDIPCGRQADGSCDFVPCGMVDR